MDRWIHDTLSADQLGLAVLPASFLFGLLGSVSSCCTLPVIGAMAGYAGALGDRRGQRDLSLVGLSFMIGTILSLAALGAVAGFIGHAAGSSLGSFWRLAAGLLMVLLGLISLDLLSGRIPRSWLGDRADGHTILGALAYGLALGGGTTACSFGCNPLLPMAMGMAVMNGATFLGVAMLALFAVGYSLPLAAGLVGIGFGLGRLAGAAKRVLTVVRIGGGVVLIADGFYLLSGS